MKEKFEHKLTNRIREVFDHHLSGYNPQDWEDLKPRLSELPVRRHPFFWNLLKAASVALLLIGVSYLILDRYFNDPKTSVESTSAFEKGMDAKEDTETKEIIIENPNPQNPVPSFPGIIYAETHDSHNENSAKVPSQNQQSVVRGNDPVDSIGAIVSGTSGSEELPEFVMSEISGNNGKPGEPAESSNTVEKNITPPDLLNEIPGTVPEPEKQKIKLGLEIASFTNYSADDITPSMNYGGGLIAHIPVKSRFSFNSGLIVTAYNMNMNAVQEQYDENVFTTTTVQEIIENNPDIKPVEVKLTGIDIPVNFQYRFIQKKKSGYFVELGISNLVYLSENYTYSITKVSGPDPFTGTQSEETITGEKSNSAFETFDFAKLINFSLGWNYRLNNRFDLSLNPYLKYPVGSLGSGEVKFGSGGLKMKLMVRPGKK